MAGPNSYIRPGFIAAGRLQSLFTGGVDIQEQSFYLLFGFAPNALSVRNQNFMLLRLLFCNQSVSKTEVGLVLSTSI